MELNECLKNAVSLNPLTLLFGLKGVRLKICLPLGLLQFLGIKGEKKKVEAPCNKLTLPALRTQFKYFCFIGKII